MHGGPCAQRVHSWGSWPGSYPLTSLVRHHSVFMSSNTFAVFFRIGDIFLRCLKYFCYFFDFPISKQEDHFFFKLNVRELDKMSILHTKSITSGFHNIWLCMKNTVCSKLVSLLPSSHALLPLASVPLLAVSLSWTAFLCPVFFILQCISQDFTPTVELWGCSSCLISFLPE